MKKVLALALASAMALGMATTAFAAKNQQYGLYNGYTDGGYGHVSLGTSQSVYKWERVGETSWDPDGTTYSRSGEQYTVNYGSNVVPNA